jgi:hypothetical protein
LWEEWRQLLFSAEGQRSGGGLGVTPPVAKIPRADSLADEGPLWDGLQGADPPAHLGCSVELQSHPRGEEGVLLGEVYWGREGRVKGCREGALLDATLHHAVFAVSPAGAGLVTLKD